MLNPNIYKPPRFKTKGRKFHMSLFFNMTDTKSIQVALYWSLISLYSFQERNPISEFAKVLSKLDSKPMGNS
jgi:hypothetical protein